MKSRIYVAIDLKSFYASVECRERGLDPMDTNLVVADESRTEKTICLAVTPSLKRYGIFGRSRLFQVNQRVDAVNAARRLHAPGGGFHGSSCSAAQLDADPGLSVDFLIAPPRMARYVSYSTWIYQIYTRYIAPEDIIVYSIDEVFLDVTNYLSTYKLTPYALAQTILLDILRTTGITATAGIGPNLFLCKVALDILAKRVPADACGVRIAQLDEASFRRTLWPHRPLTDFWRVGSQFAKKLEAHGMFTLGDVARCSLKNEDLLYSLFGKNAELLIDHAWGWEPCTIADVKAYRPASSSLSSGQVLSCPYSAEKARLVLWEMADSLALELVRKGLAAHQLVITIGYDTENVKAGRLKTARPGAVVRDRYGRLIPKHATGTVNLDVPTASSKKIIRAAMELYDKIADQNLLVRRLNLTANRVISEDEARQSAAGFQQLDLFTSDADRAAEQAGLNRERRLQEATLAIRKKYGKNALLKGANLQEGATARSRNQQIGGHKA